ncbi:Schizosaccharomyces pombe specific protein [Schizosaccharomyces pombe]|uniref:Uncharacterized protein PJ695.02 n=1 Tax=Schizosaccharomyces pombe (strain 972 / ATCC 24843) TaxID=284812 RepID=YI82_SCHPO|nr:uncharacterized protein SPAPJ695.02 [Schizosaccharomyces pombe]G2TRM2.1 RecName: Full=Uncharacterized protein PJ695.02 [Schizosaccharomyces pombe 972h-]CCD31308.1 sequence orphan [Schizosaccharomyces pombe]|eukprot:NP_001343098.1 uncharacterized protein SPAPJ695.02 [Schizosaccharomyces pombe]
MSDFNLRRYYTSNQLLKFSNEYPKSMTEIKKGELKGYDIFTSSTINMVVGNLLRDVQNRIDQADQIEKRS